MIWLLLVALALTILYVAGAIYVAHKLQQVREHFEEATRNMEIFIVRIPLGEYSEGTELTPWNMLQSIEIEPEEEEHEEWL